MGTSCNANAKIVRGLRRYDAVVGRGDFSGRWDTYQMVDQDKAADAFAAISNHDPLYGTEAFTPWSRHLHNRMPLPAEARILFDSTVEEPLEQLAEVVRQAFHNEVTSRYQSVFARGNVFLIAALAKRYGVSEDEVLPTTGVVAGLRQVLSCLIRPGDKVAVETPCFDVLPNMVGYAQGQVVPLVRQWPRFDITPEAVEALMADGCRMVLISHLHNPSGMPLSEARLAELEAVVRAHDGWLVVDEVYADMARVVSGPLQILPRLIRLNSLSKVFGLHGLRCGWIVAEQNVLNRIVETNSPYEFGPSKLSHAVAALVLEQPEPFEIHSHRVISRSRAVMEYHLAAMAADGLIEGGLPAYGCMAFPRVVGHEDTLGLAEVLWRDHGLVSAPGEMFGLAGHMRLGLGATVESMDDGLARLHKALKTV